MIEIEKKFLLSDEQRSRLLNGAESLGGKNMEDSYYDTDDYTLTRDDYWLRMRDGAYELKAPLKSSGSGATNRYNEITELAGIAQELGLPSGDLELELSRAGIKQFITCYTARESYGRDRFHVDIDQVTYRDSDYSYAIAEVELLVADESQAAEAEVKILQLADELDLTVGQTIPGKVIAYLQVEAPEHYQALVDAGVI